MKKLFFIPIVGYLILSYLSSCAIINHIDFERNVGFKILQNREFKDFSILKIRKDYDFPWYCYKLPASFYKAIYPVKYFAEEIGSKNLRKNDSMLIEELNKMKKLMISNDFYAKAKYPDRFSKKVLELANKYYNKPLNEINPREAIILTAKIVRAQMAEQQSIDAEIAALIAKNDLDKEIWDRVTYDMAFLAPSKLQYYCGFVSIIGVFVFDELKKVCPMLAHTNIYYVDIPGPAHAFDLVSWTKERNLMLATVDFMKDFFWNRKLAVSPSSPDFQNQIDMYGESATKDLFSMSDY